MTDTLELLRAELTTAQHECRRLENTIAAYTGAHVIVLEHPKLDHMGDRPDGVVETDPTPAPAKPKRSRRKDNDTPWDPAESVWCENCGKGLRRAGLGPHLRACRAKMPAEDVAVGADPIDVSEEPAPLVVIEPENVPLFGGGPIGHLPVIEDVARAAAAGGRITIPPSQASAFRPRPNVPSTKPADPDLRFSLDDARAAIERSAR